MQGMSIANSLYLLCIYTQLTIRSSGTFSEEWLLVEVAPFLHCCCTTD